MRYARIQSPSGKVYDAVLDASSAIVLEDGKEKDTLPLSSVRFIAAMKVIQFNDEHATPLTMNTPGKEMHTPEIQRCA